MRYMLADWDLKELFLRSALNFLYQNYKVIIETLSLARTRTRC